MESGWIVGVAAVARGQVRVMIEFDPGRSGPSGHGVKELRLSVDEAAEIERALSDARSRAGGGDDNRW